MRSALLLCALIAIVAASDDIASLYTDDPHLFVQFEFKHADWRHLTPELQARAIENYARFVGTEFDVNAHVIRNKLSLGAGGKRGIRSQASLRIAPNQQQQRQSTTRASMTSTVNIDGANHNETVIRTFNMVSALKTLNEKRDLAQHHILQSIASSTGSTGRGLSEYIGWRHPLELTIRVVQDVKVKVHAGNVKTATAPLPKRKSAKNGQEIVIPPEQLFKPRAVTYTSSSAKAAAVPWPLDRLNQVGSQLDGNTQKPTGMLPPVIGHNVPMYIMDTGVLATHVEFGGRVELVHDQFPAQTQHHGHGTHVASDCCGNTIGPNPFTKIYDVRTLDATGSAYWFDITEAAEGALAHCLAIGTKNTTGCIWNQSFGGSGNPNSTDAEPLAAILGYAREDCDALIVAAAGNSADDTCMTIPAGYSSISQGRVMAVGATDRYDKFATFSNRGPCNFINAPGVDILGAWNTGNNAYAESDGTSFAAPYTAGLASIYYLWFQGNWSQENPGELRADHVRAFMYNTALCTVKNLPSRTTCALIHYSSAAIDPSAPLQDPSPLTPLRSNDASALTVGVLFVAFVVIVGLVFL